MKKVLLVFSCAFSLCFFGCASKDVPSINENDITAPELEEQAGSETEFSESTADENIESTNDSEENESDNDIQSSEENSENAISDTIENENPFELEDIDEPVVITLEPPLNDVEDLEEPEEQPEEELLEPEEVELPKEEDLTESETQVSTSQNENANLDNDNIENDDTLSPENSDDVIDITDDDASAIEDISEAVVEEIIPSRKVTMKKSEYLDIVYPGNGWVFMGLVDGSKDLTYFGRKLGTGQTKFTLQAKNAGTKIIHFYKEDNLTTQTLDDYIEVEILNEKSSNKDHISAPEYKLPLSKKAKEVIETNKQKAEKEEQNLVNEQKETEKTEAKTVTPAATEKTSTKETKTTNSVTKEQKPSEIVESITPAAPAEIKKDVPVADPKLLLKEAQVLYNEKEYEAANKKLDEFFEVAVNKRDDGLFLRGQILEAKSKIQNVKEAIEAYTTLTKNYPASKYWDDANKRIIYLKRFYLEVR